MPFSATIPLLPQRIITTTVETDFEAPLTVSTTTLTRPPKKRMWILMPPFAWMIFLRRHRILEDEEYRSSQPGTIKAAIFSWRTPISMSYLLPERLILLQPWRALVRVVDKYLRPSIVLYPKVASGFLHHRHPNHLELKRIIMMNTMMERTTALSNLPCKTAETLPRSSHKTRLSLLIS